MYIGTEL